MNPARASHYVLALGVAGLCSLALLPPAWAQQPQEQAPVIEPAKLIEKALELFEDPLATFLKGKEKTIEGVALDRTILDEIYKRRESKPVWDTKSESGRAALAAFLTDLKAYISYHGLEETIIPFPLIETLLSKAEEIGAPLKIELLVTNGLIDLAQRISGQGVTLAHLYAGWRFDAPRPDIAAGLSEAFAKNTVHEYFAALAPSDQDYARLAATLALYREYKAKGGWQSVPDGTTIKQGIKDARLPLIIQRLEAEGYTFAPRPEGEDSTLYTPAIMETVVAYQKRNGLEFDGSIGSMTIASMNKSVDDRIGQIIANMERKRHMPREAAPDRRIVVNIASARVRAFNGGEIVYDEPVVVGRRDRKTPFIHSAVRSVIFNPAWHVPAKIAREDILPKLRKDPHYLEKLGFVINGSADDPHGTQIDWDQVDKSAFNFRLRQSPGETNSLGRIKFDFDNDFAVYMHGTPHEELFAKAERHLSSGCVRLKGPEAFAALVLAGTEGEWSIERAKGEIDKRATRWLKIAEPWPLTILYETVYFPERSGPASFAADVYKYDKMLLDALRQRKGE